MKHAFMSNDEDVEDKKKFSPSQSAGSRLWHKKLEQEEIEAKGPKGLTANIVANMDTSNLPDPTDKKAFKKWLSKRLSKPDPEKAFAGT